MVRPGEVWYGAVGQDKTGVDWSGKVGRVRARYDKAG
jgi:hypothetical protein